MEVTLLSRRSLRLLPSAPRIACAIHRPSIKRLFQHVPGAMRTGIALYTQPFAPVRSTVLRYFSSALDSLKGNDPTSHGYMETRRAADALQLCPQLTLQDFATCTVLSEAVYKMAEMPHQDLVDKLNELVADFPSGLIQLTTVQFSRDDVPHQYLMGESGNRLYVAFMGTKRTRDLGADMQCRQEALWSDLKDAAHQKESMPAAHKGFLQRASTMDSSALLALYQKACDSGRQLVFCGHSLGAAVATLCTLRLLRVLPSWPAPAVSCLCFAAPAVGNTALAKLVQDAGWSRFFHYYYLPDDGVMRLVSMAQQTGLPYDIIKRRTHQQMQQFQDSQDLPPVMRQGLQAAVAAVERAEMDTLSQEAAAELAALATQDEGDMTPSPDHGKGTAIPISPATAQQHIDAESQLHNAPSAAHPHSDTSHTLTPVTPVTPVTPRLDPNLTTAQPGLNNPWLSSSAVTRSTQPAGVAIQAAADATSTGPAVTPFGAPGLVAYTAAAAAAPNTLQQRPDGSLVSAVACTAAAAVAAATAAGIATADVPLAVAHLTLHETGLASRTMRPGRGCALASGPVVEVAQHALGGSPDPILAPENVLQAPPLAGSPHTRSANHNANITSSQSAGQSADQKGAPTQHAAVVQQDLKSSSSISAVDTAAASMGAPNVAHDAGVCKDSASLGWPGAATLQSRGGKTTAAMSRHDQNVRECPEGRGHGEAEGGLASCVAHGTCSDSDRSLDERRISHKLASSSSSSRADSVSLRSDDSESSGERRLRRLGGWISRSRSDTGTSASSAAAASQPRQDAQALKRSTSGTAVGGRERELQIPLAKSRSEGDLLAVGPETQSQEAEQAESKKSQSAIRTLRQLAKAAVTSASLPNPIPPYATFGNYWFMIGKDMVAAHDLPSHPQFPLLTSASASNMFDRHRMRSYRFTALSVIDSLLGEASHSPAPLNSGDVPVAPPVQHTQQHTSKITISNSIAPTMQPIGATAFIQPSQHSHHSYAYPPNDASHPRGNSHTPSGSASPPAMDTSGTFSRRTQAGTASADRSMVNAVDSSFHSVGTSSMDDLAPDSSARLAAASALASPGVRKGRRSSKLTVTVRVTGNGLDICRSARVVLFGRTYSPTSLKYVDAGGGTLGPALTGTVGKESMHHQNLHHRPDTHTKKKNLHLGVCGNAQVNTTGTYKALATLNEPPVLSAAVAPAPHTTASCAPTPHAEDGPVQKHAPAGPISALGAVIGTTMAVTGGGILRLLLHMGQLLIGGRELMGHAAAAVAGGAAAASNPAATQAAGKSVKAGHLELQIEVPEVVANHMSVMAHLPAPHDQEAQLQVKLRSSFDAHEVGLAVQPATVAVIGLSHFSSALMHGLLSGQIRLPTTAAQEASALPRWTSMPGFLYGLGEAVSAPALRLLQSRRLPPLPPPDEIHHHNLDDPSLQDVLPAGTGFVETTCAASDVVGHAAAASIALPASVTQSDLRVPAPVLPGTSIQAAAAASAVSQLHNKSSTSTAETVPKRAVENRLVGHGETADSGVLQTHTHPAPLKPNEAAGVTVLQGLGAVRQDTSLLNSGSPASVVVENETVLSSAQPLQHDRQPSASLAIGNGSLQHEHSGHNHISADTQHRQPPAMTTALHDTPAHEPRHHSHPGHGSRHHHHQHHHHHGSPRSRWAHGLKHWLPLAANTTPAAITSKNHTPHHDESHASVDKISIIYSSSQPAASRVLAQWQSSRAPELHRVSQRPVDEEAATLPSRNGVHNNPPTSSEQAPVPNSTVDDAFTASDGSPPSRVGGPGRWYWGGFIGRRLRTKRTSPGSASTQAPPAPLKLHRAAATHGVCYTNMLRTNTRPHVALTQLAARLQTLPEVPHPGPGAKLRQAAASLPGFVHSTLNHMARHVLPHNLQPGQHLKNSHSHPIPADSGSFTNSSVSDAIHSDPAQDKVSYQASHLQGGERHQHTHVSGPHHTHKLIHVTVLAATVHDVSLLHPSLPSSHSLTSALHALSKAAHRAGTALLPVMLLSGTETQEEVTAAWTTLADLCGYDALSELHLPARPHQPPPPGPWAGNITHIFNPLNQLTLQLSQKLGFTPTADSSVTNADLAAGRERATPKSTVGVHDGTASSAVQGGHQPIVDRVQQRSGVQHPPGGVAVLVAPQVVDSRDLGALMALSMEEKRPVAQDVELLHKQLWQLLRRRMMVAEDPTHVNGPVMVRSRL